MRHYCIFMDKDMVTEAPDKQSALDYIANRPQDEMVYVTGDSIEEALENIVFLPKKTLDK